MKRTLSLLLAALLLGGIGSFTPLSAQDDPPEAPEAPFCMGMGAGMGWAHGEGVIGELELTDNQRDRIRDLRTAHQKDMVKRRADLRIARIELRELIDSDADRAQIDAKIEQIGQLRTEMQKAQVGHRLEVKELLTPEQLEKLEDLRPVGKGFRQGRMGKTPKADCPGHGFRRR
jgi:Spy/CpxP family protein refolding chaperone